MIAGRSLVLLALALAASGASAQVYRWTEGSGEYEPYLLQVARKNAHLTLYSAPGCEPCGAARKLLNARGVPSLVVGASAQQGFEESRYHALLDAAATAPTGPYAPGAWRQRAQRKPAP